MYIYTLNKSHRTMPDFIFIVIFTRKGIIPTQKYSVIFLSII